MTIIDPSQVPNRKGSNYPDRFKSVVAGREKKRLGEAVGFPILLRTY
ncbi:hypothetical protein H6F42_06680 [Pseudanabaena sp. FACHB-1998]|nr:hypothetical protein [Pseudanabaena sp. FACHB-1998]MBD2176598.1 hypothetical protein [Pseudanabaena sp. FACHB-1998]